MHNNNFERQIELIRAIRLACQDAQFRQEVKDLLLVRLTDLPPLSLRAKMLARLLTILHEFDELESNQ